jgi:diguanylate cyclase (GGDEF)-like protein/PAS domain S-box-containing protein
MKRRASLLQWFSCAALAGALVSLAVNPIPWARWVAVGVALGAVIGWFGSRRYGPLFRASRRWREAPGTQSSAAQELPLTAPPAAAFALDAIIDELTDAALIVTAAGVVRRVNDAVGQLLGYPRQSLQGKRLVSLISADDRPDFQLRSAGRESRDYFLEAADGSSIAVVLTGSSLSATGEFLFILRDASRRHAAERRVNFLAENDGLTRIPNRMQYQHLLGLALARARRRSATLALLYIDVDRFKDVNDSFGHAAGDRALELLSERLTQCLPAGAVLGRLAGNEFSAFLPDIPGDPRALVGALARDLSVHLSRAFFLAGSEIYLTVSIGIALAGDANVTPVDLIRCADIAMYHAKDSGGGTHLFYTPTMSAVAAERLVLKNKLRRSLELNELVTLYQPLVSLGSGQVVGAEALLRWRLPGHGDIPPSEFIPLAEQSGLIHEIGEWVFGRVCADYATWTAQGIPSARLSINLSLRQFSRSGTVERIAELLRAHKVPASRIELEITESTLMDSARSGPSLEALTALGFRLAIDDFGTGYSSLAALRQMPVQTLKIDRSFIQRIVDSDEDALLVRTIIEMGCNLGLEVVAEGIESIDQQQRLAEWGCHLGQGRLFGDPMTAGALTAHLHRPAIEARIRA